MPRMSLLAGFALQILTAAAADAACPTFPYTFSNGSTADANQINGDFANVITCFAPLAAPSFTGGVMVGTSAAPGTLVVHSGTNDNLTIARALSFAPGMQIGSGNDASTAFEPLELNGSVIALIGGPVGIALSAPQSGFTLEVNGPAGGSSAWIDLSDARLKTKVEPISEALSLVMQLRGVRFQWKSVDDRTIGKILKLPAEETEMGLIAQEVQAVVPEVVVAPKRADDELYGLKESALVPLLIEAVKQQQGQIAELRAQVAALRSAK